MKVKTISIRENYDGEGYACAVKVSSDSQELNLQLPEELTTQVIEVIADLIVKGTQQIAADMNREAMALKAIEHVAEENDDD